MSTSATPVRGTKDYLPDDMIIRDYVYNSILITYKSHGFQKISTPMIEDIKRLNNSEGGENLNLIFKILKRGKKLDLKLENLSENDLVDSGLRYDLTLPLARFYSNNHSKLSFPFKSIQIDKVFRAEKPQKGRLREFIQCDIDIIGNESVDAETELIHTTAKALLNLGFSNFKIRINDRHILTDIILFSGFKNSEVQSISISFDKLDKIGILGVKDELIEKGFNIDSIDKFINIIEDNLHNGINNIRKYSQEHEFIENITKVIDTINNVSNNAYKIEYDISLTRGMGYYTGLVFEIVCPEFSSSIAGGGRYDHMIGQFLGYEIPAVGFSIGFERIVSILNENKNFSIPQRESVALLYDESDSMSKVLSKADEIRAEDYNVSIIKKSKKIRKQLTRLQKEGFKYSYIFGKAQELNVLSDEYV